MHVVTAGNYSWTQIQAKTCLPVKHQMYWLKNYCADRELPTERRRQIAATVSALRARTGWSQAALAKRSGMSQRTISGLEDPNGPSPTLKTIESVAKAFQATADGLFLSGQIDDVGFLMQIQSVIEALAMQDKETRAVAVEMIKKLAPRKP